MVVVVLGHRPESERAHAHLRRRVDMGLIAAQTTETSTLIFTGGKTNPEINATECELMCEYAQTHEGLIDQIHVEQQAQDTIGNGYFTRRLVDDLKDDFDTLYVVSAAAHMMRVRYIFKMCFGERYTINTDYSVPAADTSIATVEAGKQPLQREARFFRNVTPGDVDAIGQRLADEHEYYERLGDRIRPMAPSREG